MLRERQRDIREVAESVKVEEYKVDHVAIGVTVCVRVCVWGVFIVVG